MPPGLLLQSRLTRGVGSANVRVPKGIFPKSFPIISNLSPFTPLKAGPSRQGSDDVEGRRLGVKLESRNSRP